jgi:DNA polymerase-3 subunit delta
VKVDARRADGLCSAPPAALRAILLYGPNEGLVRERAERAARAVVPDPRDPFRLSEPAPAEFRDEPARLADELAALALGGGRRVVRLRGGGDGLTSAIEAALGRPGEALLIVEAGELGARSSLRKMFEGAEATAAIACYEDGAEVAETVALQRLAEAGLRPADEAVLARLIECAGGDRLQLIGALDKLILYVGDAAGGQVGRGDVDAVVGDGAELSLDELCQAVGLGELGRLDRALARAERERLAPVALVRTVARHLARLHAVAAQVAGGRAVEAAMMAQRPPVFYPLQASFRRQLALWGLPRLGEALVLLADAEAECKTSGLPGEAIAARALLRLAGAARGARAAG